MRCGLNGVALIRHGVPLCCLSVADCLSCGVRRFVSDSEILSFALEQRPLLEKLIGGDTLLFEAQAHVAKLRPFLAGKMICWRTSSIHVTGGSQLASSVEILYLLTRFVCCCLSCCSFLLFPWASHPIPWLAVHYARYDSRSLCRLVNDQTNATTQPIPVHPSERFKTKIGMQLGCPRPRAINVGRQYARAVPKT